MEKEKNFDVIVIGSGLGSLTAAAILAKLSASRVLILEQHYTAGGQTHAFYRKGKTEFDIGLHYVGSMDRGQSKNIFDFITEKKVQWQKMPDDFEKFSYPEIEFSVPSDKVTYKKRLIEKFPNEQLAIERYFNDIKIAGKWFSSALMEDILPFYLCPLFRFTFHRKGKLANITTENYLNQNFKDPVLKALLASQWGDYGIPPNKSPFGMHALVVAHYLRGAWYPVGGAKTIAQAVVPVLERYGGKILRRRSVSKILIKNGKAYGVSVHMPSRTDGPNEEFYAPIVISGAGAEHTYNDLIPENINIPFRNELKDLDGTSAFVVYLGLKESPEVLGIKGENHWVFDGLDHSQSEDENGFLRGYYLSFPSLKNSLAKAHTADIITFINYNKFEKWSGSTWKKRSDDYENFKKEYAQKLIAKVNQRIPGFADLIESVEVSTPLTMEHFLKRKQGLFYGVPVTQNRLFKPWTHAKTPVRNLFLTGTDVMVPGIVGAMMGGVKTAGAVIGAFGFFRIMKKISKAVKL